MKDHSKRISEIQELEASKIMEEKSTKLIKNMMISNRDENQAK